MLKIHLLIILLRKFCLRSVSYAGKLYCMKIRLLFFATFFISVLVQSQTPSAGFFVKGKIIDNESSQPMEYVNVVLYRTDDSSLVTGTISQADGAFSIRINFPGKYYLTADFIGYARQTINDIELGQNMHHVDLGEIRIQPSLVGIDAVEVVSERPLVSYQIDKKVVDVSNNPMAQGGTAVEALENVPSINVDMEGNLTLRGSANYTVLIDGRQSPLSGTDALNQIPASAIDKIEIITNPSAKYDPDGTTGIINIVSKKGKLQGHSLVLNMSAGTSPMYSSDVNYTYRKNKLTFNGNVSMRNSQNKMFRGNDQYISYYDTVANEIDSITNLVNNANGKMQHSSYSVKGSVDYEIAKGNILTTGLSYNNFTFSRSFDSKISNYYGQPWQTYQLSSSGSSSNPHTLQFNIGDKQTFGGNTNHFLTIDAMYQRQQGLQTEGIEIDNTNSQWESISQARADQKSEIDGTGQRARVEVAYQLPVNDKITIETGYTLRIDKTDQEYKRFSREYEAEQWLHIPGSDDESVLDRTIHAGWALAKGEIRGFGISGGLRVENTDQNIKTVKDNYHYSYNYLGYYPSLAISKSLGKDNTFQATYSKRINRPNDWQLNPFPTLSDGYTIFKPNPELEPEYASVYELNYQRSWGMSFLSVESFFHRTTNKMERLQTTENDTLFVFTMVNQGSDSRLGGELGGQVKINKWFTIIPGLSAYYYELIGEYDGKDATVNSFTWEADLTGTFTLPTKSRLQLMAYYRGAEIELDEEEEPMYWFSGAIRHDFFDRKLAATFRVDDMFATRKREGTIYSENSVVYTQRYRKSPVFVLSLNLRLNQGNNDRKRGGREGMEEGGSGGMDMEF